MSQTVFSFIVDFIEIIFVTYVSKIIHNKEKGINDILLWLVLCVPIFIVFEDISWKAYLMKKICLLLLLIFYFHRCGVKIGESTPVFCALLGACEVLEILAAVVGGVS